MRIGFATPLAATSAIARVSAIVCDELATRGHRVDIIRAESRDGLANEPLKVDHSVTDSRSLSSTEALANYDVLFLNIGDNFTFHGGVFEYLRKPVAIGIFHDFYLFNLFNGWRDSRKLTAAQSSREIVETYGNEAAENSMRALRGEMEMGEIAAVTPMTEWVARRCAGALAHSSFYLDRLRNACAGPVDVARLPWPGRDIPAPSAAEKQQLSLVTVGVVNPNKCVDVVIDAIGRSEALRGRVRYTVAGPVDAASKATLEDRAGKLGVDFRATGSVSDAELLQILSEADIVSCLRRPVLEGASASAIEGMLSGRPTIVSDAGFYAELPDEHVVKVPETFTAVELSAAIEKLAGDPQRRLHLGAQAKAWAASHFSVQAYADQLESMAADVIRLGPYFALGDQTAHRLARLGIGEGNSAPARLAAAIDGMRMPRNQSARPGVAP